MSKEDISPQEAKVCADDEQDSNNISITGIDMFPRNPVVISDSDKRPEAQDVDNNVPIMVNISHEVGICDLATTHAIDSAKDPPNSRVTIIIDRLDAAEDNEQSSEVYINDAHEVFIYHGAKVCNEPELEVHMDLNNACMATSINVIDVTTAFVPRYASSSTTAPTPEKAVLFATGSDTENSNENMYAFECKDTMKIYSTNHCIMFAWEHQRDKWKFGLQGMNTICELANQEYIEIVSMYGLDTMSLIRNKNN